MPVVSVPRSFGVLTSRKAWTTYYKKLFDDQTKATKAQRALRIALAQISVPDAFTRQVACFETSKQNKAVVQAASPEDFVCVLARSVRQCLSQSNPPPAVLAQVTPAVPVVAANGPAPIVPSAASAIGSQGSALVNLLPPVPALTAI